MPISHPKAFYKLRPGSKKHYITLARGENRGTSNTSNTSIQRVSGLGRNAFRITISILCNQNKGLVLTSPGFILGMIRLFFSLILSIQKGSRTLWSLHITFMDCLSQAMLSESRRNNSYYETFILFPVKYVIFILKFMEKDIFLLMIGRYLILF